jgi:hypothetical protein
VSDHPPPKRDELWDVMVAEMGPAPFTRSGRGAWNKAHKELRDARVTAAQLRYAIEGYRDRWPDVEITPTALAKHLHLFLVDVDREPALLWVDPVNLDKHDARPIVLRYPDGSTTRGSRALIDGPSELVHRPEGYPDGKRVALETYADVELVDEVCP